MRTSERDFTNMLTQLANDGMKTERLKASGEKYQEFSRVAADWVSEVALKRYRSLSMHIMRKRRCAQP